MTDINKNILFNIGVMGANSWGTGYNPMTGTMRLRQGQSFAVLPMRHKCLYCSATSVDGRNRCVECGAPACR